MLASKLWRHTTVHKQVLQREPARSRPRKPVPASLSFVLMSRDSSSISRYAAESPESTGLVKKLFIIGSFLVAVPGRVFIHRHFARERAVNIRGISHSEDHSHNPPH